jgi:hypothetical protein
MIERHVLSEFNEIEKIKKILKKFGKENDLLLLQEVVDDWYYNNIQKHYLL